VTEVPEHLLKRSRDRRAALGLGGGGDGGGGAGSESAPGASESESTEVEVAGATAAARPAAVEPLEPATPPKPVPSYVRAALNRKKIPVWVMPVLAFLPIWAVIYVNTLSKPYSNVPTQIAEGAIVFSDCSGCHGSQGEGGVGRQLNNGEVLKTFPYIADQLEFVWIGDQGIGNGNPYGNKNRPGGPHIAGSYNGAQMPAWNGTLTQADLLAVVRHERETLTRSRRTARSCGRTVSPCSTRRPASCSTPPASRCSTRSRASSTTPSSSSRPRARPDCWALRSGEPPYGRLRHLVSSRRRLRSRSDACDP